MPTLTYFTAKLRYQAIVADEDSDSDADPDTKGFFATVIVTPFIKDGDGTDASEVQAGTLSPVTMLALAPVKARLDNGILMLRVDPDRDVDNYASASAFPATGVADQLYRATDTGLVYEWDGDSYEQVEDYTPVRLVAQTDALGLPNGATLNYRLSFENVVYNQQNQELASFAFQAPTSDVKLDLATVPRVQDA
ncbi:hypothetical protein ACEWX3_07540 [Mycobacterium sp. G7A2]|uniref:hypothetical protein n=1 Tax=Mycobacterium sp. G7A2 TaxID=3317307 RepID=UPI0035A97AF6